MQILTTYLPEPAEDEETIITGKLSSHRNVKVEPVGRWFESFCIRRLHKQTLSEHSLNTSSSESECDDLSEDEDDGDLIKTLDPKNWKDQDHYAVLGIRKLRFRATDDQIKRAYKKKVLHHHPDKRRARGVPVKEGEEDYFTCITRAWETLGNPTKRRAYDSIDPEFDDDIPDKEDGEKDFFGAFTEVFERNARWSTITKGTVPKLGDNDTTFEQVENFYGFWYELDSWREFSYLDEEEKEKGENRDERRWIEKQNKAARQKRKKEEITRVRNLVDTAYATDPRIIRHFEEKKQAKIREKEAKKDAARKKAAEEERKKQEILDEERKIKEKEAQEAKAQAAAGKKEREAHKKVMKKERKTMRTKVKEFNYFSDVESEHVQNMADVDRLAELMSVTSLQSLNSVLVGGDIDAAKNAFATHVQEMNDMLEQEKAEALEAMKKHSSGGGQSSEKKGKPWSEEEINILIKGVNLFPAGTNQRWDTIANFITQHCPSSTRSAKEVLNQAKKLQSNDSALKEQANNMAFDKFEKSNQKGSACIEKAEKEGLSERYVSVAEAQMMETGFNPSPWTPDEQKLLEQGLKTYGANVADRWEKICDSLPERSKKDCMKRYKELVGMIKAKKLAQIEAQKKAPARK